MRTLYCSVCSTSFDVDEEGCEGNIGLIPFAFCATCRVGIWEWAQISFDLHPASEVEDLRGALRSIHANTAPNAISLSLENRIEAFHEICGKALHPQ
jgi:hypothetical protein